MVAKKFHASSRVEFVRSIGWLEMKARKMDLLVETYLLHVPRVNHVCAVTQRLNNFRVLPDDDESSRDDGDNVQQVQEKDGKRFDLTSIQFCLLIRPFRLVHVPITPDFGCSLQLAESQNNFSFHFEKI